MKRALACSCALLTACLPQAWQDEPAKYFHAFATTPKPKTGGGAGGGSFGGGAGGFGGGMMPMGGGGPAARPPVPEVTGSFPGANAPFSRSPLRSSPLSTVPGTHRVVAVVDDSDALYLLGMPNQRFTLPAGSRPSSVAVAPDGLTAWVALRGLGAVARVILGTGEYVLVPVGAEPVGVALAPSGRTLVVATFGERTISLVDTSTLAFSVVDVGRNPRALTITDDGDADDADESVLVTLFFGELQAEGTNAGVGKVVEVNLGTRTVTHRITLAPIMGCVPNQLAAITQVGRLLYVAHTCALPAAPQNVRETVGAGLSVIDRTTRLEVTAAGVGSRLLTGTSLNFSLMANPIDVAPFDSASVVVLSQGANELKVSNMPFSRRAGLSSFYMGGGGPEDFEEPEAGVPTGVLSVSPQYTLVLDATGRRVLQFFSLDPMSRAIAFPFETLPPVGSAASKELLGRRHFTTAEGPWSAQNAMSCSSCHPDGLTDGLTWVFAAGPRQTPSLTGTFERGQLSKHRAQGWTATSDELSDVEHIVRTLAGGSGLILDGFGMAPVPLGTGYPGPGGVARHDGLSASSRDLVLASPRRDWIDVEAWIASLPRPPASKRLDPLAVSRGRQLFANGGCAACHGGPLWTVSRIPYVPSFGKNGSAVGDNGLPAAPSGLRLEPRDARPLWNPALNTDTLKVAAEQVMIDGGLTTVGPERITCVLRDVGTFDRSDPLEVKSNGQPAQGELGFNPPSLFGLATSAPYLHHGKAKTLEELFSAPFASHHQAAASGFLAAADGGVNADQVSDLSAFLESIDEETLPFPIPFGTDVCGAY